MLVIKKYRKIILFSTLFLLFLIILFTLYLLSVKRETNIQEIDTNIPPNIILLIGDGMGTEHIKLIKAYQDNLENKYIFENCPNKLITNDSLTKDSPTDSAASATAIATGRKVLNGVLSIDPLNGNNLETILEILKTKGYSTGLVTTTEITHATPAAFASHTESRSNEEDILEDFFTTKPDIIFGGLNKEYTKYITEEYEVVTDKEGLFTLTSIPVLGLFGNGGHIDYVNERDLTTPSLLDMTNKAIELLGENKEGFFLMVEGGRIDHASHANDTQKVVYELEEFIDVIEYVYNWAITDPNTVVIVVADHETGGLEVLEDRIPNVSWSSTGHTNSKVPLYICFDEHINISEIQDNTDIFEYMNSLYLLSY